MQTQQAFRREDLWSMFPQQTSDFANTLASANFKRTEAQRSPKLLNQTRYKTEICRSFEESGQCKYGEKCQFAHGLDEVRQTNRHPKYKTQMCRTFHSWGFCPYGPRCHFIHNEDAETLEIARGLSPLSPNPPNSPSGSPLSSSPTSFMFFNDEDPFPSMDQSIDLRFPFLNTKLLSSAHPRTAHRRLPIFAQLNNHTL